MKKLFATLTILLLFSACFENKELGFYYLQKHKREKTVAKTYYDKFDKEFVYAGVDLSETVLIRNRPKSIDSLKMIMLGYFDTINQTKYVETKFSARYMEFHEYNNETDNFLHNTKDPYELANIYINDVSGGLGYIRYDRCQNDSLKWIKIIEYWDKTDTLINDCKN